MFPLRLSALVLILANLIPVAGVIWWNWDIGSVIVLYWFENVIIGVLNLPKMWMTNGSGKSGIGLSLFFALHYGMFTGIHGVFVFELLAGGTTLSALLPGGILFLTVLVMTGSHILSFIVNYIGGREFDGRSAKAQMARPYARVIVLHIVILAGAALVESLGSPLPAMLMLIGVKIVIDLIAHTLSHKSSAGGLRL